MSPFKHIPKTWKKGGGYAIDYNQSIGGIKNIAVSDDLICFSLFLQNYNEAAKTDFASNELFCFDWDGNKVKKYVLPFPIGNFCIDELISMEFGTLKIKLSFIVLTCNLNTAEDTG